MKRFSSVAATLCILLGIGVTGLAMLSSRYGWPIYLERLSHFQMQYLLIVLLLTLVALCLKRSRSLLLMFFCCALLSVQTLSWYSLNLLPVSAPNYRVLSANLLVQNSQAQQIIEFVEQEQPDLALFMEVNDAMGTQLEALKSVLPYSSNQQTTYRLGTVLYSKTPLTAVQLQQFNTRSAVNMTAQVQASGQPISVVGIHPFPPVRPDLFDDRNQVFAAVADYVRSQSNPVILIGDFNTTMWSPYYRQLVRKSGLKSSRTGLGILPTWPASLSYLGHPELNALTRLMQIPIDQCLASPALNVVGMHTGPDVGSDHLPIVVDFRLES